MLDTGCWILDIKTLNQISNIKYQVSSIQDPESKKIDYETEF